MKGESVAVNQKGLHLFIRQYFNKETKHFI